MSMMRYLSGGYTQKELGQHFGLYFARLSRIVGLAGGKTWPYQILNTVFLTFLLRIIMMKITSLLVLLGTFLCTSVSSAHDFKVPQQAVDAYIKGVSTGSGEHVEMAFMADATIKFYDQEDLYREYSRESFANAVNKGEGWDAAIETTALLVTGNAANATVEFTWGENGEHGYVDYLNLINSNGSWHITNKVAQYISRKK